MRIRGHHIRVLMVDPEWFRGAHADRGNAFLENYEHVRSAVWNADVVVEITDQPDDICASCGNRGSARCTDRQGEVAISDRVYAAMYGLEVGSAVKAFDLLKLADRYRWGA